MEYSKELTTEFLNQYKKIELVKKSNYLLYEKIESRFHERFELFRRIRNELSHNECNGEYPLVISSSLVEEIKMFVKRLSAKAIDECVKIQEIKSVNINDTLYSAIALMRKHDFTHLPIFDSKKCVKYVVSTKSIVNIIAEEKESFVINDSVLIKDHLRYFDMVVSDEYYMFIDKNHSAYDIKDLFQKRNGVKRCSVIFVTEHGKKDESVLGLLTPYDVLDL